MVKFYNITRTLYKVSDFITFLKSNNLDLSPRFQRRSVWSKGTKSTQHKSTQQENCIDSNLLRCYSNNNYY